MAREERKKWILEHPDVFINQGIFIAEETRDNYIKEVEKISGKKYNEGDLDWMKKEDPNFSTPEDWYQRVLNERANIEYYLNNNELLNFKEFRCDEKVSEIILTELLETIRFDHKKENGIVLYIKKGKVIEKDFFKGGINTVDIPSEVITEKAKKLKSSVYVVHNHPCNFSARPTKNDILLSSVKLKTALKEANVELLDWGVVTEWDYFSAKQMDAMEVSPEKIEYLESLIHIQKKSSK